MEDLKKSLKRSAEEDLEQTKNKKRPRVEESICSYLNYDVVCNKNIFNSISGRNYCYEHYGSIKMNICRWFPVKDAADSKCFYVDKGIGCNETPYGFIYEKFTYCRNHLCMVATNTYFKCMSDTPESVDPTPKSPAVPTSKSPAALVVPAGPLPSSSAPSSKSIVGPSFLKSPAAPPTSKSPAAPPGSFNINAQPPPPS